jgi:hypothetical protein
LGNLYVTINRHENVCAAWLYGALKCLAGACIKHTVSSTRKKIIFDAHFMQIKSAVPVKKVGVMTLP